MANMDADRFTSLPSLYEELNELWWERNKQYEKLGHLRKEAIETEELLMRKIKTFSDSDYDRELIRTDMTKLETQRAILEVEEEEYNRLDQELYNPQWTWIIQEPYTNMPKHPMSSCKEEDDISDELRRIIEKFRSPVKSSSLLERPSGLKLKVNGKPVNGFGDTGSKYNIVDKWYIQKRKVKMISDPKTLTMGNGASFSSAGYVNLQVSFAGEQDSLTTIVARVVENFPFDLLLAKKFLKATRTLTDKINRFVTCRFPRLRSAMSCHFVDGVSERFHATLGDGIAFEGVLDTGSNCNIISLPWAAGHGFEVLSAQKHQGWISLPTGDWVPTLGQVHTTMTLPDGQTVPMVFEVIEDAVVPIILRDKFIFDNGIYANYANHIFDSEEGDLTDEVLHMDYIPWYARMVQKAKQHISNTGVELQDSEISEQTTEGEELQARWEWDNEHENGKLASLEEWVREYNRREAYEMKRNPSFSVENALLITEVSQQVLNAIGEAPFSMPNTK